MRSHQPEKRSPGWLFRNNHQFLAFSQVPREMNMTASEVTDAVSRGDLEIVRIADCKAVALADLYRFIDMREARK